MWQDQAAGHVERTGAGSGGVPQLSANDKRVLRQLALIMGTVLLLILAAVGGLDSTVWLVFVLVALAAQITLLGQAVLSGRKPDDRRRG